MEAMAKTATNGRANGKATYDESKIKTLSSLEHIRLRTGMYIGRLGSGADPDDGIYVLLKEVIDNAVDEFIMGCGKQIDVKIDQGLSPSPRLRPRHSPRQGRRVRLGYQHRCQIQRRRLSVQRGAQRRRHQGRQRAFGPLRRPLLSRRPVRRSAL